MNKYPDIVPEEAPLIVLYSKSSICMANNGRDTRHTRQISRRIHFVSNGENCKMQKKYWCEVGMQLAYIATNNVGKNYLTPIINNIMVRLGN